MPAPRGDGVVLLLLLPPPRPRQQQQPLAGIAAFDETVAEREQPSRCRRSTPDPALARYPSSATFSSAAWSSTIRMESRSRPSHRQSVVAERAGPEYVATPNVAAAFAERASVGDAECVGPLVDAIDRAKSAAVVPAAVVAAVERIAREPGAATNAAVPAA